MISFMKKIIKAHFVKIPFFQMKLRITIKISFLVAERFYYELNYFTL